MPRGFLSESGVYEEYHQYREEYMPRRHRNEIFCEKCNSTFAAMPLDPRKMFQYWQCFGCKKTIKRKDVLDAMKRAASVLEQELPEIRITPLLGHISIKSNIVVGADRREARIEKLSPQTVFRVKSELLKLVSEYLQIRVRSLNDCLFINLVLF